MIRPLLHPKTAKEIRSQAPNHPIIMVTRSCSIMLASVAQFARPVTCTEALAHPLESGGLLVDNPLVGKALMQCEINYINTHGISQNGRCFITCWCLPDLDIPEVQGKMGSLR